MYCPLVLLPERGHLFWSLGSFHSVYSPRMLSGADIALSTCEVTMKPQSCSRRDCGRKVVKIVAASDFIKDGDRRTRIITEPARSQSPLWKSHDPPDAFVSDLLWTLLWWKRITVFKKPGFQFTLFLSSLQLHLKAPGSENKDLSRFSLSFSCKSLVLVSDEVTSALFTFNTQSFLTNVVKIFDGICHFVIDAVGAL